MNILDSIKLKIGTTFARNLAEEMEAGKFGPTLRRAYIATKGQKTFIGTVLTTILLAVTAFGPPFATDFFRYASLVATGLTALGLLDKARRSEPIFDPWFLQALAEVSAYVSGFSAFFDWLVSRGLVELMFPGRPGLTDEVTFYLTALTTSTAFLNRVAMASAAMPKPAVADAIEGQE